MFYVEVIPRIITHKADEPLTYGSETKLAPGDVVSIEVGAKSTQGVVVNCHLNRPAFAVKTAVPLKLRLPRHLIDCLEWMSEFYATPRPLILNLMLPKGLDRNRKKTFESTTLKARSQREELKLSKQQQSALKKLRSGSKQTKLLFGPTGSGKSLLYKELIKETLTAQVKSALVLVPEIGLTPQIAYDLGSVTGNIYVLHSGLSEAERHRLWLAISHSTKPMLVIGARSALFAPINNLGLIIVDESHETAYKQDVSPRYQAQSVAAYIAESLKCQLILGSATPRVTDYFRANQSKGIVNLPSRSNKYNVDITVVDQSNTDMFSDSKVISTTLLALLRENLQQNRQSLLYVNRRGTATTTLCSKCGWTNRCEHCHVSLTLHGDSHTMRCHHCGRISTPPKHCPECGSLDIYHRGIGTKRIETELQRLFPGTQIARFDSDNKAATSLTSRYQELREGHIPFIIGTQSVARGLDLPQLKTVGVISVDNDLLLPDFSTRERAFQLLSQVIGRVGRNQSGSVVIQSRNPNLDLLRHIIDKDYEAFYKEELNDRKSFRYPPFSHLLALITSAASAEQAQKQARQFAQEINDTVKNVQVIGPAPAFYERLGQKYRWTLIVKASKRPKLVQIAALARAKRNWQYDLDPINLLY